MMDTKTLGLALLVASLTFIGCSDNAGTPEDADTTNNAAAPEAGTSPERSTPAEHAHGTGPNGGVVFDLGKYHAEFTVDHPNKTCTILILGDDEKTPMPIAAEEFTLSTKETQTAERTVVEAMTITMEPQDVQDGKASKFVGTDPGIGNVADFQGTVIGEIDGKPSQGEFQE